MHMESLLAPAQFKHIPSKEGGEMPFVELQGKVYIATEARWEDRIEGP